MKHGSNINRRNFLLAGSGLAISTLSLETMVKMLANALRVRSCNMLSASATYNAGLSKAWTNQPIYTQYGLMPAHEEISQRYHAA